jgi:ABC-type antimicrobial peptide transport system permease subunit
VTTKRADDVPAVTAAVQKIIGPEAQIASQDSLPGEISQAAAMTAAGSGAFVLLILAVGGLLVIRASLSSVRERVVEIGIMRALGWRKRHVASLLGYETTLQGILGAVPGAMAGYGVAFAICANLNLSLPASFDAYPPCGETGAALDLTLEPTVSPDGIVITLLLTVALAVVAGLIAGRYAASRAPMDSLRQP